MPQNKSKQKNKRRRKQRKRKTKNKNKNKNKNRKKTQYRGVYWDQKKSKWNAFLTQKFSGDGKYYFCGSHAEEKQAAMAANAKCIELGMPLINDIANGCSIFTVS